MLDAWLDNPDAANTAGTVADLPTDLLRPHVGPQACSFDILLLQQRGDRHAIDATCNPQCPSMFLSWCHTQSRDLVQ